MCFLNHLQLCETNLSGLSSYPPLSNLSAHLSNFGIFSYGFPDMYPIACSNNIDVVLSLKFIMYLQLFIYITSYAICLWYGIILSSFIKSCGRYSEASFFSCTTFEAESISATNCEQK